ncbi:hypothetical protein X766_20060 [Mesorhizobium sp. LSJC255A00]|nr:hypothetical protein X766_20060 [Mesorhizobium sp. LSJC255A00]
MGDAMRRHRHGNVPKTDSNAIGCMITLAESFCFAPRQRRYPFDILSGAFDNSRTSTPALPSALERRKDSGFFVIQTTAYARFLRRAIMFGNRR